MRQAYIRISVLVAVMVLVAFGIGMWIGVQQKMDMENNNESNSDDRDSTLGRVEILLENKCDTEIRVNLYLNDVLRYEPYLDSTNSPAGDASDLYATEYEEGGPSFKITVSTSSGHQGTFNPVNQDIHIFFHQDGNCTSELM